MDHESKIESDDIAIRPATVSKDSWSHILVQSKSILVPTRYDFQSRHVRQRETRYGLEHVAKDVVCISVLNRDLEAVSTPFDQPFFTRQRVSVHCDILGSRLYDTVIVRDKI